MTLRNKYDGETPDMSDLIKMGAEGVLENFYAMLPGRIVSYDAAKGCADVKPVVKNTDADGNPVDMPVIRCCQVVFPAGGGYSFVFPLEPGDPCIVVFSSRSLAQWAVGGDEEAKPESPRRGDLADGVVIPGLRPQNGALAAAQGGNMSLGLDDGSSTITIDAAGLVTVADNLQVGGGSAKASNDTLLQAELAKIKTSLDSLILAVGAGTPYVPGSTDLVNITGD